MQTAEKARPVGKGPRRVSRQLKGPHINPTQTELCDCSYFTNTLVQHVLFSFSSLNGWWSTTGVSQHYSHSASVQKRLKRSWDVLRALPAQHLLKNKLSRSGKFENIHFKLLTHTNLRKCLFVVIILEIMISLFPVD